MTNFIRADVAVLALDIGTDTEPVISGSGFEKLAVRMVSSTGDTVRDTLNEYGKRFYDVRPMSAWKVNVEALVAGTVVRSGSATSGRIPGGDTLRVAVSLLPHP
ncbi:MAG TPA: hypothetical protein VHO02_07295 [Fibrobacteria bacterium]|nr:hypothetical protein [Fibrobacteria bacterium]